MSGWMGLLRGCLTALLCLDTAAAEYFAVCDAGSTGTRLYIFDLDAAKSTAKAVFVKKTKPGLSSYASDPQRAVQPLLKLFADGAEKVPVEKRKRVSVAILGTAGMRLLATDVQASIWSAVLKGMSQDAGFPFAADSLEARTVSGEEEGRWSMLTANFLTGRMSHDLAAKGESPPVGLMDLGGSSTQIAVPSASNVKLGRRFDAGAVVHSYLGFGMTHLREQVHKESDAGVDMACYMHNTEVDGAVGAGDGAACRQLISRALAERTKTCHAKGPQAKPCLGDLALIELPTQAIKTGSVDFFGVAGMTYVTDFIRWWLELQADGSGKLSAGAHAFLKAFPRPTLAELQAAADELCAGDYKPIARLTGTAGAHKFTQEDNAPYRCFQANYILVLLEEIYGFSRDGRTITFALDVDGEDLEWPLGALLAKRAAAGGARTEL